LSDWQRIERSTLRSLSAGFCVLPKKFSPFPADVVAPNGGLLGALDGVRNWLLVGCQFARGSRLRSRFAV